MVLGNLGSVGAVLLGIVALVVYLLPSFIGFYRGSDNRWLVLVVNVLFGATFVGWLVALYLATRKVQARPQAA
ncbi:superinfection immunity protein [Streptomyces sp. NPDC050161]|uniref:superinfection immunity protein n=1 Tax=Streptomyces sp. NPDC050161 TaxID=3365604 RepID=UPI00379113AC